MEETKTWEGWEQDLGTEIPKEMWEDCVSAKQKSSICIGHGLVLFEVLYRLQYSNDRLFKIYPSVTPICPRCNNPTLLGHVFWSFVFR